MSIFKDKVLLITGGTGSFGNAVLRRFLESDIKEIRIFSRDEKKQDDMRHHLQAGYPEAAHKVKFYIGNVRNRESVDVAMNNVGILTTRSGWIILLRVSMRSITRRCTADNILRLSII